MSLHDDAVRIASGHAWSKHGHEFAGFSQLEFAAFIERIMQESSEAKNLTNDRTAFWDDASGTVVIYDPNSPDLGTAFKPSRGRTYFDYLR
jgi:filamentous hemagglutinin